MVYERLPATPDLMIKQVYHNVQTLITGYKHARKCIPYQNMEYLSEVFVKLGKAKGTIITIHDILAFTCLFCGHGPMNRLELLNGEIRELGFHNMHECARECCGRFLDRRYLQYTGETVNVLH